MFVYALSQSITRLVDYIGEKVIDVLALLGELLLFLIDMEYQHVIPVACYAFYYRIHTAYFGDPCTKK